MTDITSPSMEYRIYSSDWSTVLVLRELLYCKLELTISTVEVGWLGRSAVGSGAGSGTGRVRTSIPRTQHIHMDMVRTAMRRFQLLLS